MKHYYEQNHVKKMYLKGEDINLDAKSTKKSFYKRNQVRNTITNTKNSDTFLTTYLQL